MLFAEDPIPGITNLPGYGIVGTLMAILIGVLLWEVREANKRTVKAEERASACEKEKEQLHRDLLEAYKVTTPALIKSYEVMEKAAAEVTLSREDRRPR